MIRYLMAPMYAMPWLFAALVLLLGAWTSYQRLDTPDQWGPLGLWDFLMVCGTVIALPYLVAAAWVAAFWYP